MVSISSVVISFLLAFSTCVSARQGDACTGVRPPRNVALLTTGVCCLYVSPISGTCADIVATYGISLPQLGALNPDLGVGSLLTEAGCDIVLNAGFVAGQNGLYPGYCVQSPPPAAPPQLPPSSSCVTISKEGCVSGDLLSLQAIEAGGVIDSLTTGTAISSVGGCAAACGTQFITLLPGLCVCTNTIANTNSVSNILSALFNLNPAAILGTGVDLCLNTCVLGPPTSDNSCGGLDIPLTVQAGVFTTRIPTIAAIYAVQSNTAGSCVPSSTASSPVTVTSSTFTSTPSSSATGSSSNSQSASVSQSLSSSTSSSLPRSALPSNSISSSSTLSITLSSSLSRQTITTISSSTSQPPAPSCPRVTYEGCYVASTNNLAILEGAFLVDTVQYADGDISESPEQCATACRDAAFVMMIPGTCFCLSNDGHPLIIPPALLKLDNLGLERACSVGCLGNSSETCGALTVQLRLPVVGLVTVDVATIYRVSRSPYLCSPQPSLSSTIRSSSLSSVASSQSPSQISSTISQTSSVSSSKSSSQNLLSTSSTPRATIPCLATTNYGCFLGESVRQRGVVSLPGLPDVLETDGFIVANYTDSDSVSSPQACANVCGSNVGYVVLIPGTCICANQLPALDVLQTLGANLGIADACAALCVSTSGICANFRLRIGTISVGTVQLANVFSVYHAPASISGCISSTLSISQTTSTSVLSKQSSTSAPTISSSNSASTASSLSSEPSTSGTITVLSSTSSLETATTYSSTASQGPCLNVAYHGCYLASTNNLRLLEGNNLLKTVQYTLGDRRESPEQCATACDGAEFVMMVPGTCYCLSRLGRFSETLNLATLDVLNVGLADLCSSQCPGNPAQTCGALTVQLRVPGLRALSVDLTTIYSISRSRDFCLRPSISSLVLTSSSSRSPLTLDPPASSEISSYFLTTTQSFTLSKLSSITSTGTLSSISSTASTISSLIPSQSCPLPACFHITVRDFDEISFISLRSLTRGAIGLETSDEGSALVWSYDGIDRFKVSDNSGTPIGTFFATDIGITTFGALPIFFAPEIGLRQNGVNQLTSMFKPDCSISFAYPLANAPLPKRAIGSTFIYLCTGERSVSGSSLYLGNSATPPAGCNLVSLSFVPAACPRKVVLSSTASATTHSLLSTTSAPQSASSTLPVDPCTFAGCYTDHTFDHALQGPHITSDTMTLERCTDFCAGYFHYGLVGGKQCHCGETLQAFSTPVSARDPDQCSIPCAGKDIELCGGRRNMDLYVCPKASTSSTVLASTSHLHRIRTHITLGLSSSGATPTDAQFSSSTTHGILPHPPHTRHTRSPHAEQSLKSEFMSSTTSSRKHHHNPTPPPLPPKHFSHHSHQDPESSISAESLTTSSFRDHHHYSSPPWPEHHASLLNHKATLPPYTASVVYVTSLHTVLDCPVWVIDCPVGQVMTSTIASYTTLCPVKAEETSQASDEHGQSGTKKQEEAQDYQIESGKFSSASNENGNPAVYGSSDNSPSRGANSGSPAYESVASAPVYGSSAGPSGLESNGSPPDHSESAAPFQPVRPGAEDNGSGLVAENPSGNGADENDSGSNSESQGESEAGGQGTSQTSGGNNKTPHGSSNGNSDEALPHVNNDNTQTNDAGKAAPADLLSFINELQAAAGAAGSDTQASASAAGDLGDTIQASKTAITTTSQTEGPYSGDSPTNTPDTVAKSSAVKNRMWIVGVVLALVSVMLLL